MVYLSDIRAHFLDTVGADETRQIIMANQPASEVDQSKLWARFTVTEGQETPYVTGAYYLLGLASLQIFVPIGQGTQAGYDLASEFKDAFRDWRSDDNLTQIYKFDSSTSTNSDAFMIVVYAFWKTIIQP